MWQARLAGVSATDFPLLSRNLPLLADQAFMLRWRSGVSVALDSGFACYLDIFIAGLETVAARTRKSSPKRRPRPGK